MLNSILLQNILAKLVIVLTTLSSSLSGQLTPQIIPQIAPEDTILGGITGSPIDPSQFSKEIKDRYSFKDNTFTLPVKTDWKDKIDVEVGSKSGKFEPQIKITRWDEVDLNIKLKDDSPETPIITTEGNKIKFIKNKIEAHFYDLPISESNPEGGYEFEVILKEKPLTNKIEFTLGTKGLDFFYQPPLTEEELAQGAVRPENVVGSYAVYTSEQKTNWTGGKEYKVGKVGHIFRPKIIDSIGKETWGTLNIDKGILSVEIPQSFLDTADYPVIVDPTFGYTRAGSGFHSVNPPLTGIQATGVVGTATKITASINLHTTLNAAAAIYLHSSVEMITNGNTIPRLGTGSKAWLDFTFSTNPSILAVSYILLIHAEEGNTANFYYDTTGAGHTDETYHMWSEGFPTFTPSHYDRSYSIYVTYTATSWWDTNYQNRIGLTLTGVTSSANLDNFPVLISLNSSRIDYAKTQNSGQDIRFVDSDDVTALYYEIEKWDETATSTVWVKVPNVATSTTDFIYMYYNNVSATDNQSSTAVWDSNFMGVWHFGVSSTSQIDSTINNNVGTLGGGTSAKAPDWSASGTIDGVYDYTLANEDCITMADSASLNVSSNISVEALIYIHSNDNFAGIVTKDNSGPGYSMRISTGPPPYKITWRLYNDDTNQLYAYVSSSQWAYVIGTYNGTSKNILLYINGTQRATATLSPGTATSTIALMIGSLSYAPTLGFDGYIDEVRISNTDRSAAWIITDYNSGNDSLLAYGAAESAPTGGGAVEAISRYILKGSVILNGNVNFR